MIKTKKTCLYVTRSIEGIDQVKANYPQINFKINESDHNLSQEELLKESLQADALVTMLCDNIDLNFLNLNQHLKVISNYAVGLNNINLSQAKDLGIRIGHTPNVLTHSTAETAIMLLLNLSRKFNLSQLAVKNGEWKTWEPLAFNGDDLRTRKIGIIGFGRIGQDFAAKAHALWNTEILVLKRESYKNLTLPFPFKLVEKEEFYTEVDVVSLHCPLTQETYSLIDNNFIEEMKKPFYLINTARGAVHDETSILMGLKARKILGVGLDVTNPEPMLISNELITHPLAIVLPHIGSATNKTRFEMTKMSLENIVAGINNKTLPYAAF